MKTRHYRFSRMAGVWMAALAGCLWGNGLESKAGERGYAGWTEGEDESGRVVIRGVKAGETALHRFQWKSGKSLEGMTVDTSCECVSVAGVGREGKTNWADVAWTPTGSGFGIYTVSFDPGGKGTNTVLEFEGDAEEGWASRDWGLYATVEEEEALLENPLSAIWVDLRDEEAFRRGHVPGAMLMSSAEAGVSPFLKRGRVVLVDAGGNPQLLERTCARLRESGAEDVKAWYGGMNAWIRHGGDVEGLGPRVENRLTVREAQRVDRYGDWLVVDAGGAGSELGTGTGWVSGWADEGELRSMLDEIVARAGQVRGTEALSVLLMTEDGVGYVAMDQALQEYPAYVYFLEGGKKAWNDWRTMMDKVAKGGKVEVVTSGTASGCSSCAAKRAKMLAQSQGWRE